MHKVQDSSEAQARGAAMTVAMQSVMGSRARCHRPVVCSPAGKPAGQPGKEPSRARHRCPDGEQVALPLPLPVIPLQGLQPYTKHVVLVPDPLNAHELLHALPTWTVRCASGTTRKKQKRQRLTPVYSMRVECEQDLRVQFSSKMQLKKQPAMGFELVLLKPFYMGCLPYQLS